jgi:nitrate/nitrite transporter NarK
MGWCHLVAGRAVEVFGPTIITSFGYTNVDAVLFGIPIHTVGVLWGSIFAVIADRYGGRCILLSINVCVAVAGLGLAGYDTGASKHIRLLGYYLTNMGIMKLEYLD